MKLIHCWSTTAAIAAALLLTSSRPLVAAELTASAGDVENPDLSDTTLRDFRVSLLGLFNSGRYADLDSLAQQLQQQRSRFEGGAWRLHIFFGTLSSPGSPTATDAAWKAHIARLEQWAASSPASPTPRIALAQTYLRFAWKARGHGYANTVTPEAWELFRSRVGSARSTLEQSAALAESSPHWYLEMQGVALDQQWGRAAFDALAERALAHEPGYHYFAVAEANYLLPKWYGRPGDTERYAAQVADRIGGDEGDAVYFQIAAVINCCNKTQAPALSWPRVQRGFAAIESLYKSTNHERNVMAYLALRSDDAATAQQLFARIGNDWSEAVWKTKAAFDAGRTGNTVRNSSQGSGNVVTIIQTVAGAPPHE
ncbi:MAG TPA: hypothetical protein VK523_10900 [Steroidobacteraceae bacterium]|nr:hypothetical protein [Steroidobacteraceae bacterium]